MNRETKAGDVVRTSSGVYRMYYTDTYSKTGMRCMNLFYAESYNDSVGNSKQSDSETFVFNMKGVINNACADKP